MSAKDKITTWHFCSKCGVPLCSDTADTHVCSDKAKLAKFAGLKQWTNHKGIPADFYVNEQGRQVCYVNDWNPLDPAHGWLVLMALAQRLRSKPKVDGRAPPRYSQGWGWTKTLNCLMIKASECENGPDFHFWPAVNQAALDIIDKEDSK